MGYYQSLSDLGGKGNIQIQSAPASTWEEGKKEKGCKLLVSEMNAGVGITTDSMDIKRIREKYS